MESASRAGRGGRGRGRGRAAPSCGAPIDKEGVHGRDEDACGRAMGKGKAKGKGSGRGDEPPATGKVSSGCAEKPALRNGRGGCLEQPLERKVSGRGDEQPSERKGSGGYVEEAATRQGSGGYVEKPSKGKGRGRSVEEPATGRGGGCFGEKASKGKGSGGYVEEPSVGKGGGREAEGPTTGRGNGRDAEEPSKRKGKGRHAEEPAKGKGGSRDDARPAKGRGSGRDAEERGKGKGKTRHVQEPRKGEGNGREVEDTPQRGVPRGVRLGTGRPSRLLQPDGGAATARTAPGAHEPFTLPITFAGRAAEYVICGGDTFVPAKSYAHLLPKASMRVGVVLVGVRVGRPRDSKFGRYIAISVAEARAASPRGRLCDDRTAEGEPFCELVTYAGRSAQFVVAGDTFVPVGLYARFLPIFDGDTLSGRRVAAEGGRKKFRAVTVDEVTRSAVGVTDQEAWLQRSNDLLAAIAQESGSLFTREDLPIADDSLHACTQLVPSAEGGGTDGADAVAPAPPAAPPTAAGVARRARVRDALHAGDFAQCAEMADEALAADAACGWALSLRGWLAFREGDLDESERRLLAAKAALREGAADATERALCCYRLGRLAWRRRDAAPDECGKALAEAAEAAELLPAWGCAHELCGLVHLQLGEPQLAARCFRAALECDANCAAAAEALCRVELREPGGRARLDALCEALVGPTPVAKCVWASVWLGWAALERRAWLEAQQRFRAAIRGAACARGGELPVAAEVWFDARDGAARDWVGTAWGGLSHAYEGQGRVFCAARCVARQLARCREGGAPNPAAEAEGGGGGVVASAAMEREELVDAVEAAAASAADGGAVDPRTAPTHEVCLLECRLGGLHLELQQLDAAVANFCAALRSQPLHLPSLVGLANACLLRARSFTARGEVSPAGRLLGAATVLLRTSLLHHAPPLLPHQLLALTLAAAAELPSAPPHAARAARRAACALVHLQPGGSAGWLQLARACDPPPAELRVCDAPPAAPSARCCLPILQWLVRRGGEAREQAAAWNALGVAAARAGEAAFAQHALLAATQLAPLDPTAWVNYATLCLARGDVGLARQAFACAQQRMPSDYRGWAGQARCAELSLGAARLKNAAVGSPAIQSMLRHSLEQKVVAKTLAHLGAEALLAGTDDTAFYCGAALCALCPDEGWGYLLCGLYLEACGQLEQAKSKLEHALRLFERQCEAGAEGKGTVEVAVNLARVHVKLGECAHAQALLDAHAPDAQDAESRPAEIMLQVDSLRQVIGIAQDHPSVVKCLTSPSGAQAAALDALVS
ncbi:hypothetical protein AB1Y20_003720 [Prymnesium parvum]|uniref:Uncharacterized protein n=1 Tax=Prymnesium parvum TaxID=97485 RepID=A0AB34J7E2_PRYPA